MTCIWVGWSGLYNVKYCPMLRFICFSSTLREGEGTDILKGGMRSRSLFMQQFDEPRREIILPIYYY